MELFPAVRYIIYSFHCAAAAKDAAAIRAKVCRCRDCRFYFGFRQTGLFFFAAAVVAAAGFLLSGNKRNKNASRPFNWLDFLNLSAFCNPSRSPCWLDSRVCFTFFFRFTHEKFVYAASV
jgi:hypothetical protein